MDRNERRAQSQPEAIRGEARQTELLQAELYDDAEELGQ